MYTQAPRLLCNAREEELPAALPDILPPFPEIMGQGALCLLSENGKQWVIGQTANLNGCIPVQNQEKPSEVYYAQNVGQGFKFVGCSNHSALKRKIPLFEFDNNPINIQVRYGALMGIQSTPLPELTPEEAQNRAGDMSLWLSQLKKMFDTSRSTFSAPISNDVTMGELTPRASTPTTPKSGPSLGR